jgi:hypothetical protein
VEYECSRLIDLTERELDAHLAWALEHRPWYTQIVLRVLGQAAARKRERCEALVPVGLHRSPQAAGCTLPSPCKRQASRTVSGDDVEVGFSGRRRAGMLPTT